VVAAIETRQLTKTYGHTRGITDVNLEVRQGEVFGLLGPNGAGKTTTLRLLLDFIRPTSGSASVLGLDSRRSAVAIHRRIGYLPGELALYPKMTGEQLLAFIAQLGGERTPAKAAELADRLDLDLSRAIGTLSKGNKQKVGIVQAFAFDAELLILDEPTSGLDPLMQDEFHHLVSEAVGEGRTVLLSSHRLDEVQRIADRVGIVRDGKLVVVEEVGVLRAKALRQLTFHFAAAVRAEDFAGLPGVHDVEVSGDRVRLSVRGAIDAVIKAAAKHEVIDLVAEEGDLDAVFLKYFTGEDG
jgi:ABC-2 type transport system ATP-binding protein